MTPYSDDGGDARNKRCLVRIVGVKSRPEHAPFGVKGDRVAQKSREFGSCGREGGILGRDLVTDMLADTSGADRGLATRDEAFHSGIGAYTHGWGGHDGENNCCGGCEGLVFVSSYLRFKWMHAGACFTWAAAKAALGLVPGKSKFWRSAPAATAGIGLTLGGEVCRNVSNLEIQEWLKRGSSPDAGLAIYVTMSLSSFLTVGISLIFIALKV